MQKAITAEINGIKFKPINGVDYRHDYINIYESIAMSGTYNGHNEISVYRKLIKTDLFFIVYFVMNIEEANNKFVVDACRLVEEGPQTLTLDIWARMHFKSTIITIAETLQYHLKNPEKCTVLFSYTKPAATTFLKSIKNLCEQSDFLKHCFPDILYKNPSSEAPNWSETSGITLKRQNSGRKESTIEAWGLIDGQPTGKHFDRRIYDDVETDDIGNKPEQLEKLKSKFDMSENLGKDGDIERVVGTFYSHNGGLTYIRDKKNLNNELMYTTRIKPATHNGLPNGKPVLLSQKLLDKLKQSKHFNSQQLCDPTPVGTRSLESSFIKDMPHKDIPSDIFKFLLIDPAGEGSDNWAIMLIGVDPYCDEIGANDIFILDAIIDSEISEAEAPDLIAKMYLRGGIIDAVGVEKVGLSTTEIHVAKALIQYGRRISIADKTLILLKPAGRNKVKRIESALAWPLCNGKIHMSDNVDSRYSQAIRSQIDGFPFDHDDAPDILSYTYDIINDPIFKYRTRKTKNKVHKPTQRLQVVGSSGWMGN